MPKFDFEEIQKRLKPPDYKPDIAKVRRKRAEQAKVREMKKMRELVRDEK